VNCPSDINPRMFAVEFNHPPGRVSFTIVLLALSSKHALAQAFWIFPGFRRTFPKGHVQEAAFVDIDWEVNRAFVAKRKSRPPMLPMEMCGRKNRTKGASRGRSNKEEIQE
jgi:hypothetical protein